MKQWMVIILLIVGSLTGFTGYCFAWIDWVQDLTGGVYANRHGEAALETSALFLYSYGGIRFINRRLNS